MNGRDDTTTFLPLDSRIGRQNKKSLTVGQYLTRDQTRYIYVTGMEKGLKREDEVWSFHNNRGF